MIQTLGILIKLTVRPNFSEENLEHGEHDFQLFRWAISSTRTSRAAPLALSVSPPQTIFPDIGQ